MCTMSGGWCLVLALCCLSRVYGADRSTDNEIWRMGAVSDVVTRTVRNTLPVSNVDGLPGGDVCVLVSGER